MSGVTINGDLATVRFDRFDPEAHELFLRAKRLPEKRIEFDWDADAYILTTAARYAARLDPSLVAPEPLSDSELAAHLFDYQRWIVERALEARRFACWADTGLGKTAIFLEWARHVERDGGVLILDPKQVIAQTVEQASDFYGEYPIERLTTRAELDAWLTAPTGVAITNPEKFAREGSADLRRLTGLVFDESSLLKTGGGSIKWNLIHSAKGIPYKLSCTATPAPNDTMEYASQASFLELLRHDGEILWTYFTRDKRGNWRVKPHARDAFYRFMASWSVYLRDPAAYGFKPILDSLPDPVYHERRLEITPEQREAMHELLAADGRGLFDTNLGVRERAKFAQIARGFAYERNGNGRVTREIASRKPDAVAEIVMAEVDAGRSVIVWTNFDAESELIARLLDGAGVLEGKTPEAERSEAIDAFRAGHLPVLITKPQLLGYGLNLQQARAMVFSGLDDSFERRYQAVRRAYRFGQTEAVQVHLPHVPELEGHMLANVAEKEARFEADVAQMEQNYVEATEQ